MQGHFCSLVPSLHGGRNKQLRSMLPLQSEQMTRRLHYAVQDRSMTSINDSSDRNAEMHSMQSNLNNFISIIRCSQKQTKVRREDNM